jgi:hypothetical protein
MVRSRCLDKCLIAISDACRVVFYPPIKQTEIEDTTLSCEALVMRQRTLADILLIYTEATKKHCPHFVPGFVGVKCELRERLSKNPKTFNFTTDHDL